MGGAWFGGAGPGEPRSTSPGTVLASLRELGQVTCFERWDAFSPEHEPSAQESLLYFLRHTFGAFGERECIVGVHF